MSYVTLSASPAAQVSQRPTDALRGSPPLSRLHTAKRRFLAAIYLPRLHYGRLRAAAERRA